MRGDHVDSLVVIVLLSFYQREHEAVMLHCRLHISLFLYPFRVISPMDEEGVSSCHVIVLCTSLFKF